MYDTGNAIVRGEDRGGGGGGEEEKGVYDIPLH